MSDRVDLQHPIFWNGQEITAVQLRWPSLSQFRRVNRLGAGPEHALQTIALMTGLPRPAVEMLALGDIARLKDVLLRFTGCNHGRAE